MSHRACFPPFVFSSLFFIFSVFFITVAVQLRCPRLYVFTKRSAHQSPPLAQGSFRTYELRSMKIVPAIVKAARSLRTNGDSIRAAAKRLGLSESGLRKAMARRAGNRRAKERRGRPKCLTPAHRKMIISLLDQENKEGFAPDAPYICRRLRLPCSAQTVRRVIKDQQFKFKVRTCCS